MVGRACQIGLLSMPLLAACGTGADSGAEADAAANGASIHAGVTGGEGDGGDESPNMESPCFRNPGPEAWTCNADGVTLTRTTSTGATERRQCPHGCVSLPYGFDDQCRPREGALGNIVNGHAMSAQQAAWVSYFAWCAVPLLPGTRDARLTTASIVAWWALKEGVLDTSDSVPVGLSRCGAWNRAIGPLDRCSVGVPWQVGASGIQPSCCKLSNVEDTAAALFPGTIEAQLLSGAAVEAGYPVGSAVHRRILGSTGAQRASWLLRVTAIGFFHQAPIVTDECITKSHAWCYGTGWPMSALFAPDRWSSMRAMSDLRAILDVLSP